jgi:glycosyltransferase involved in cell wall biosynthesis
LSEKVTLTGILPLPVTALVSSGLAQYANGAKDFLAGLYQSSELYVSASIDQKAEGLSLALLEAMAAGLPVVATDISGNQDVVRNSENGFLVPPEDPNRLAEAILQLLFDPTLHDRLTRNTAQTGQTFHWKQIARRHLAIYAQTRGCHDVTA